MSFHQRVVTWPLNSADSVDQWLLPWLDLHARTRIFNGQLYVHPPKIEKFNQSEGRILHVKRKWKFIIRQVKRNYKINLHCAWEAKSRPAMLFLPLCELAQCQCLHHVQRFTRDPMDVWEATIFSLVPHSHNSIYDCTIWESKLAKKIKKRS